MQWQLNKRYEYCKVCKQFKNKNCKECEDKEPEIMPKNKDAWLLFNKLVTQWNYISGMTVQKTGLRYEAIQTVADIYCIEVNPALFEKIQILENMILENQNKKANQK